MASTTTLRNELLKNRKPSPAAADAQNFSFATLPRIDGSKSGYISPKSPGLHFVLGSPEAVSRSNSKKSLAAAQLKGRRATHIGKFVPPLKRPCWSPL